MRRKLVTIALAALSTASSAASDEDQWLPRCGGPFQLCGYAERGEGGQLRIPQTFEVAKDFSEGLAAVRIDGRYGFIDRTGKIVIAPGFDAAGPFIGGYAEVRINGASGAIDRSGTLVVPAEFGRLVPFTGGTFLAAPKGGASSSANGDEVHLGGFSLLDLLSTGGGLYNLRKGWLTEPNFQFNFFDEPARGLIWAGRRDGNNEEQWGLLKSDGTWQVTPRYNHVQTLRENHAIVTTLDDSAPPHERWKFWLKGAVDRDGKLIVPLEARGISYWRGGYGPASEPGTGREGILLEDGKLLANRWFDAAEIREDGSLPRGRIGKTWYSIEPDGRLVPDQLDGEVLVKCPGGLTVLRRGDLVELKAAGAAKPGPRFDNTYFDKRDCPGPFSARRDGKWFFVLDDGKVLGEPHGFDNTYSFRGDHGVVQVGGKWGIIDRSGAFTVKPSFATLSQRGWDLFAAGNGKATIWMNGKGARVAKPAPVKRDPKQALTCEGGLRFFASEGRWGLQDGDGKTVVEPRYRALSCFHQGVSWTAEEDSLDWCPIGADGQRRQAMKCRKTFYPVRVTHHSPEKFSDDAHESSVLWTRAWLDFHAGTREQAPQWISDEESPASYSVMPGQPSD